MNLHYIKKLGSVLAIAACCFAPSAYAEETETPLEIIGCVTYTGNATERPIGAYTFTPDGTITQKLKGVNPSGGAVLTPETYWVAMYSHPAATVHQVQLLKVNVNLPTWGRAGGGNAATPTIVGIDFTYDPTTDNIYGILYNDDASGYVFGTVDYTTKKARTIKALDEPWAAIACDREGQVYAIDAAGVLLKVDKTNGETARIGATGASPSYFTSATIDLASGRFFWAVSTESRKSAMYEVDVNSGRATKLYDFANNEQVRGLAVNSPWTAQDAPSAPTAITTDFKEGSLTGDVTITMPSTLVNGEAVTGEITWKLLANGVQIATGKALAGAIVKVPVTLAEDGDVKFAAFAANDKGSSLAKSVSIVAGLATPAKPAPKVAYEDGVFTVSWAAVTGTVAGGYYDKAETKYTVTRMSDGKVIAEATDQLSVTDQLDNPDALAKTWYGVTATFRGKTSAQGVTSSIVSGTEIYPRWSDNFDNAELNTFYTVIDKNGDGKSWAQVSKTSGGMGSVKSADSEMDDWLITPAINMEGGKLYRITVNASAGYASQYAERFEAALGRDKTAEAMTISLIPRTDIHHSTEKEYVAYADIKETGKYYLGIHGCSDAGSFRLDINEIKIDDAISAAAPAPAETLVILPDEDGAPKAKFTVNAPSKTIAGEALQAITEIKMVRDGETVATVANPAPGAEVVFNDEVEKSGVHHYAIVAYNAEGEGKPLEFDVHMGVNIAASPANVTLEETENPGEVTISWDAPTLDKDGNAISQTLVWYRVERLLSSGNVVVADNLKTTSYTYKANLHPEEQEFMAFGVFAVTKAGDSQGVGTETLSVGIPYGTPLRESFANARVNHNLGIKTIVGEGRWGLGNDQTFTNIMPQDGDNGMFVMRGPNLMDQAMFYTGRIDLSKAVNPVLTFYTYNVGNRDNEETADVNVLDVAVDCGGGWNSVKNFRICDAGTGEEGWHRVDIDLTEYKDKVIQLAMTGTVLKYQFIMVDNIRLGNMVADNLAVTSISAAESVHPNTAHEVSVEVENSGSNVSTPATITLMRNGVEIKTAEVPALESGKRVKVAIEDELSVVAEESHVYKARVDYEADKDLSDNESDEITVALQHHPFPNPSNLSGTYDKDLNVTLVWEAPDALSTHSVTEDFESYTSYSNSNLGDWTLVDGDKGFIGALQNIPIPGIDQGSQQSYWVMDSNIREDSQFFKAHSGNKYLAQMYVMDANNGAIACDDWLISPELSGAAQTISLYAKTYNSKYPESFQILYSRGGKETNEFVEAAKFEEIPAEWTEYTARIPAGAKYFAVRAISYDCLMLFLDDITYQPALGEGIASTGYNVYRNGVKVNAAPVGDEKYVDANVEEGNHTYQVTALYAQGESRPSESLVLGVTGIDGTLTASVRVYAEAGALHIISDEIVETEVIAISGATVWTGNVCGHKVMSLDKGVYVIRVADKTCKLKI